MEVSKASLLTALAAVKPALAKSEDIEQGTAFAFVDSRVITFNNEICIMHPVEGMQGITGAVEAEKLYQLLNKVKADNINIVMNDDHNEIVIKSGRMRAGLTVESEIVFPLTDDLATTLQWHPLPNDFVEKLQMVWPVCSTDLVKPILMCVHVCKDGFIEGSDNYSIIHCKLNDKLPIGTFLMPASSAKHLIQFKPTMIAHGTGWVHFKVDSGATFSSRVFDETYPTVTSFLNVDGVPLTLPDSIHAVVERAWIFAKREEVLNETLNFTLSTNTVMIRSESDNAWFEERVDGVDYTGDRLRFAITPALLRDILTKTQECIVGERLIQFSGDDWIFVSALKIVPNE